MVKIRRSSERGQADHGWLQARHSFSFAEYFDPEFMQFGHLRVLNQDRIQAARGFPPHSHRDMEIVTYVLEGRLEHRDSMGNGSLILPGEVQTMSAGSGVTHSEFNASPDEPLHLLQMWVLPRTLGKPPGYAQKEFPEAERRGKLRLVVSPDGAQGSLAIDQDARMFAGLLAEGEATQFELEAGRIAWLHVARGSLELNGELLEAGDGAGFETQGVYALDGRDDAELVLWDLAGN